MSAKALTGTWRLERFEVAGSVRDLSSDKPATVTFGRSGALSGNDLTNQLTARYALRDETLVVRDTITTLVGRPSSAALHNCADALGVVFEASRPAVALTRSQGLNQLTITKGDSTVRFRR